MTLLFEQNLSPKLTGRLADVYPDSEHVTDVGLARAMDREVWSHAEQSELAIVSKDSDFSEMGVLRENREAVERLGKDPETDVLALH